VRVRRRPDTDIRRYSTYVINQLACRFINRWSRYYEIFDINRFNLTTIVGYFCDLNTVNWTVMVSRENRCPLHRCFFASHLKHLSNMLEIKVCPKLRLQCIRRSLTWDANERPTKPLQSPSFSASIITHDVIFHRLHIYQTHIIIINGYRGVLGRQKSSALKYGLSAG
jgi:hypothetical protein